MGPRTPRRAPDMQKTNGAGNGDGVPPLAVYHAMTTFRSRS